MIKSFKDKKAKSIFDGVCPKKFPAAIAKTARRKLRMLHAAKELKDLRIPPGNRLEELSKDRKGQHSIRINDQFRLCFIWNNGADKVEIVEIVEIVDYH